MKVFITIWNRFSWVIPFCEDCEKAGLTVILIDNASTYPPCIEWLKKCKYKVITMKKNEGAWAFFITDLYGQYTDRYFMISDSDQDISNVPSDFPNVLLGGLQNHDYNDIWKAGLSQEINDLPNNEFAKSIFKYEKAFWNNKTHHGFYEAWMDLGIAVYDRERRGETPNKQDHWYCAVRADRPYTSRHLDWYMTEKNMREEDLYYLTAKDPAYRGWAFRFYSEVIKKEKS